MSSGRFIAPVNRSLGWSWTSIACQDLQLAWSWVTLTVGRISTRRQVNGSRTTAAQVAAVPSPIQLSSIGHSVWERAITTPMATSAALLAISRLLFQDI